MDEYPKELMLSFEKEVLGVYASAVPRLEDTWTAEENITAVTTDFALDEETERPRYTTGSPWSSVA